MKGLAWVIAVPLTVCGPLRAQVLVTLAGASDEARQPLRGFMADPAAAFGSPLALANLQNECDPGRFEQTSFLTIDNSGNVIFPDSNNHRLRRLSPDGLIATMAGTGERPQTNVRCEPTTPPGDNGPATAARFYNPSAVVVHPNGNLIVADQQNNRIRQITPEGRISSIAGSGAHNLYAPGIPATLSPMDWPTGLALDAGGLVYFSEVHGNRIGRINADGRLATIAGTAFPGHSGDNGVATAATLRRPTGLAFDADGNLYIADTGNHSIRKVSRGVITTIAGTGAAGYNGDDQPATAAQLNFPTDIKTDSRGNLYIADTANHRVRRITPDGIIQTVAGTGEAGFTADFGDPNSLPLNHPAAIAVDINDDVYILDWQNFRIRKLILSGRPALDPALTNITAGALITIRGANFSETETTMEMAGAPVALDNVTSTEITFAVPADLSGQATLTVRTPRGASNPLILTVTHGVNP